MKTIPNMLLIGSSGRNSGKTTLACKIIHHFSSVTPVYAVKIISIENANGQCQRGHVGCGICTTLKQNFDIAEEINKQSSKDTSKMLAAGATQSFLVRSLKKYLLEAINTLLLTIPKNTLIVCESNSLREIVIPGTFLFVNNATGIMKTSAESVLPFADKVVTQYSQDDIISQLVYKQAEMSTKDMLENKESFITLEGVL